MVAGEEDTSSRVAKADVGLLVSGSVDHLEPPAPAEVDGVSVYDRVIGRVDHRHVPGSRGEICRHRIEKAGRDTVGPADPEQTLHIPRGVVVPGYELRSAFVHDEPATELSDQPGRHADVVRMQVRHHQGVYLGLFEANTSKPIPQSVTARLPVGATVEEEEPAIGLDRKGVDPSRALEGERRWDEMDAVAQ